MTLEKLIEKYTTEASHFINIDGAKVHYRIEGEGKPILLIHGTFSSLHTYDEWTKIFVARGYKVIRFDMPGFGLTGPHPKEKYTIGDVADFIEEFLETLSIKKCDVVGNSLGGWIAWEFALKYPERVRKLVLIDAAGYINDRNFPLPFVIAQTPVLRNVFNYVPKAVVRRFVRQVFHNQDKVTEDIVDRHFDMFHREGNMEAFVKIANSHFVQNTHELKNLHIPTLIIWGDKDNWLSVDHAHKFQRDIPDSKVIIYKNVGHIAMEEIPEESAEDVLKFLEE